MARPGRLLEVKDPQEGKLLMAQLGPVLPKKNPRTLRFRYLRESVQRGYGEHLQCDSSGLSAYTTATTQL